MKTQIRFNGNTTKVNYLCSSYAVPGKDSNLFVFGNEYGATYLIAATSMDEAWDEWLDDQPCIEDADLYMAYGFENPDSYALACGMNDSDRAIYLKSLGLSPSTIVEGYQYMPNSGGTNGIVDVSDYEWIREYDPMEHKAN